MGRTRRAGTRRITNSFNGLRPPGERGDASPNAAESATVAPMRHALIVLVLSMFPALLFATGAPPRTLIRNAALVVTMDPARGTGPLGLLENADVLLADGRIE